MKLNNFNDFVKRNNLHENSDLDWSDKNWDEAGQDAENPPNNGLEGSSAEQMDYFAGDADTFSDETLIDDEQENLTSDESELIQTIKGLLDSLEEKVSSLESKLNR